MVDNVVSIHLKHQEMSSKSISLSFQLPSHSQNAYISYFRSKCKNDSLFELESEVDETNFTHDWRPI